jgi:predicted GNAT family acetyltransferase
VPEAFCDNAARNRFELQVDDKVVFANYRRTPAGLQILHVEAPPVLRGTGAASRLMQHIVDAAREEGAPVVPWCGYAASWLRRHGSRP